MDTLTYEQTTGRFLDTQGALLAQCYSGLGLSKNVPGDQGKVGQGPIPKGVYTLSAVTYRGVGGPHGPFVIVLTPDPGNEMFGRSGFLIHGDSVSAPGTASHGCIVTVGGRMVREKIWAQDCHRLTVV